jgi:ParB family chromosome partitioning protein
VQTVHYCMPETKAEKGQVSGSADSQIEDDSAITKLRPDVTQKGQDMIGDFRTDSLHAPIEDDMLMALLVLAFAGSKVRVDSGAGGMLYGGSRFGRHAARLFTDDGGSVTLIRVHRPPPNTSRSCLAFRRHGAKRSSK